MPSLAAAELLVGTAAAVLVEVLVEVAVVVEVFATVRVAVVTGLLVAAAAVVGIVVVTVVVVAAVVVGVVLDDVIVEVVLGPSNGSPSGGTIHCWKALFASHGRMLTAELLRVPASKHRLLFRMLLSWPVCVSCAQRWLSVPHVQTCGNAPP